MQYLIYIDDNNELLAKMFTNPNEYVEFVASIPKANVLYMDDTVHRDNIPKIHEEVFPLFLMNIQRQWDSRKVILAPQLEPMAPADPNDTLPAPVAAAEPEAPKKRTRKKKTDN